MEKLFSRDGRAFKNYRFNDKGQPYVALRQNCSRCGGAGGAEAWRFTGWTCYRCGGKGDDPSPLILKLYTAEKNASLDAAQAKREITREKKRRDMEKLEQLRRDSERAEIISAHRDILARMRPHLPGEDSDEFNGQQFLAEMEEQISVKARGLSEKQHAAVIRIIERREAEVARLQNVRHLGEVGERMEFTLTLGRVFCDLISEFPHIYSYTVYCRTDDGCTVIYKGSSPRTIGHAWADTKHERVYREGIKVRVKATVKRHYTNAKGEPITVINRPKVLEVLDEGDMPERYKRGDV